MVCWMFVGLVRQCYAKATWFVFDDFPQKNEKIFSTECRMLGWLCHVVSFICIFKTWKTGWNVELQNAQWFCKTCNLDSLFMVLIVHETWKNTRWQTNIAMKYALFFIIGTTSSKGPFFIAMLVDRSVCVNGLECSNMRGCALFFLNADKVLGLMVGQKYIQQMFRVI